MLGANRWKVTSTGAPFQAFSACERRPYWCLAVGRALTSNHRRCGAGQCTYSDDQFVCAWGRVKFSNPYNFMMNNANYDRHHAAWTTAADLLARERVDQLQSMTDADTRRAIVRLFSLPIVEATDKVDTSCGLAEQQRLFRRLR